VARWLKGDIMQIGDKIKTIFGNVETVMTVEQSRIITFESLCKNSWYHPTKVFPVYWSETLERHVSVPED
jgi:hypothetical protein